MSKPPGDEAMFMRHVFIGAAGVFQLKAFHQQGKANLSISPSISPYQA